MSLDLTRLDPTAQAAAAARAAELDVAEIDDVEGLQRVSALLDVVWSNGDDAPIMGTNTLKALSHSGNYVAGAWSGRELVGALVGFHGRYGGRPQLHSHILGVTPRAQGRAVGYALKLHQRAWALARDIGMVTWTFDPLVRRNAYFNLSKLGASITAYYDDFYGPMSDGINAGDESDRVLVEWDLASSAVADAADGRRHDPSFDRVREDGGTVVLSEGADGVPVVRAVDGAPALLLQLPEDIVAMRGRDPRAGAAWRRGLRATLGVAVRRGYRAVGMTRSGWYVLRRPDQEG
jgi:predicted GNAT superfamily acetyltransferase